MKQNELNKLLAELKAELKALYGSRLVAVILYGSHARGEAGAHSDLDVAMVLTDYDRDFIEIDRTSEIAARYSLAYDSALSLIPVRENSWRLKQSPFIRNLRREGIEVK